MPRALLSVVKGAFNKGLAPLGLALDRINRTVLSTADELIKDTCSRVSPFTMTTTERITALCDAVRYITKADVPGDIVECGVWRGGSMMAVALTLQQVDARRTLHLFDTFAGMPPASDKDVQIEDGTPAELLRHTAIERDGSWAYASEEDVLRNMLSTGYDEALIQFHKGMVEDTLPSQAPAQLSILRLDTDWYESTKHELETLWPRLSPGGVLIIDDYGHFSGARSATDEFFAERPSLFFRIDYAARMLIKR